MPRQVRVEYPGAFYHVMARGESEASLWMTRPEAGSCEFGPSLREDRMADPYLGVNE